MKTYKGFDKDLKCRGFQYEIDGEYETEKAKACECGFHACENPFDVWDYYSPADSRFCEVEQSGEIDKDSYGSKVSSTKIKIGAEIGLAGLIKAGVKFILEKVKSETSDLKDNSSGDVVKIGSSGYGAKIGSSGDGAKIGSSGDWAQIGSSGDWAKIGSSGDWAQIGSSGNGAKIGSSGYGAKIGSSGYGAKIGSSGNGAKIGSSGDWAQIGSSGENSVICCSGHNCIAKAKKGSWITLAEWDYFGEQPVPICVKTEQVDGIRIKEDVFYTLKNGKFQEVSEID